MYRKVDDDILQALASAVGESNIISRREEMIDYAQDEFALEEIRAYPEVVVKPGSTEEVSRVARICHEHVVPLTPRGAGTGLCGGCVPIHGGVVVTFERLNRVVDVDKSNLMATVESGASLMDFYAAVEKEGLFFPPHPGDESATVGGVIATNAGGSRAVKYGVIRNFVRGLEVVLADGEIVELGGKIMKNSSGYNLLQLMIGSEGTLGIVTRAHINLLAPPKAINTLIVPYEDLHAAIETVPRIIQAKILPMAVEFIERRAIRVAEDFLDKRWPCQQGQAHLMLIIDAPSEDDIMTLAEAIAEVCLEAGAIDVFVADNREKQQEILEIRSHIYETMKHHMLEVLDVTVPRADIARFVSDVHDLEDEFDTWLPTYGHAADGNVHTHLMKDRWDEGRWTEIEDWKTKYSKVRERIHALGRQYRGVVSGEHGIGLVKKELLSAFVGERQIGLMRGIKEIFDPKGILNPGKVI